MTQAIISVLINTLVAFAFYAREDVSESFGAGLLLVLLSFVALSLVGLVGYRMSRKKAFWVIAVIGFAVFVPIGLIGLFGMKKMLAAAQDGNPQPLKADA